MENFGKKKSRRKIDDMSESSYKTCPMGNETSREIRQFENSPYFCSLHKNPVVVLTRLPECTVRSLQPPTPKQFDGEAGSPGSSDSDMLWSPADDCGDSDWSVSDDKQKPSKPKKRNTVQTPQPMKPSTPQSTSSDKSCLTEKGLIVISAAFANNSSETTTARPNLPEVEIKLDMPVLARRTTMMWQQGKIVDITEKEDGRLKYKVNFDKKGRSLVSGHHMASVDSPKLEQLYVGARVVVPSSDDNTCFIPGILVELPSRKNRLRFLVFLDDHTPLYVSLPTLHLVCRPLDDTLEDVPESPHKDFMQLYMKNWPYPHLTHYMVGQSIYVEVDGKQQKCEVQLVDCSLIQVVFPENQNKEWIYRGSLRLEHMIRFYKLREMEKKDTV
ncbi:histone-lysine N-methyltransferase SETDB1-B-like [Menidia menidia]